MREANYDTKSNNEQSKLCLYLCNNIIISKTIYDKCNQMACNNFINKVR